MEEDKLERKKKLIEARMKEELHSKNLKKDKSDKINNEKYHDNHKEIIKKEEDLHKSFEDYKSFDDIVKKNDKKESVFKVDNKLETEKINREKLINIYDKISSKNSSYEDMNHHSHNHSRSNKRFELDDLELKDLKEKTSFKKNSRKKDLNKNKKRKSFLWKESGIMVKLLSLIHVIAAIVLDYLLLTNKFITDSAIGGIIAVQFIILLILVFTTLRSKKKIIKGLGVIVLTIFTIIYGFASWMMVNLANDFALITNIKGLKTEYVVIASKNSSYKQINNIKDGDEVLARESEKDNLKALNSQLNIEINRTDEELAKGHGVKSEITDVINKISDKKLAKKVEIKIDEDRADIVGEVIDDKSNKTLAILTKEMYEFEIENNAKIDKKTKILGNLWIASLSNADLNNSKDRSVHEPFNIYLSGIDRNGPITLKSRSDVNMVATVNPKENTILLTTIPRDYYIPLHTYKKKDKLTHAGLYGPEESMKTIEDELEIKIPYYVVGNFTTLEKLINTIDGVKVMNKIGFKSAVDHKYYPKGELSLDGKGALAFARERKSFAAGDIQRGKNQQIVLDAIIQKISTNKSLLLKAPEMLRDFAKNIKTNMSQDEISQLIQAQTSRLKKWKVEKISLNGVGASKPSYAAHGQKLSVLIPDESTVKAAKKAILKHLKGLTDEPEADSTDDDSSSDSDDSDE